MSPLRALLLLVAGLPPTLGPPQPNAFAAADVPPTAQAIPRANVLRPDEPRPSLSAEEALANAPAAADDRFLVARIVEIE